MTRTRWQAEDSHGSGWLRERLSRHLGELVRLAIPAIMTRIGIYFLNIVDAAMVGNYDTDHLAWVSLATQTLIMFAQVLAIGLFSAILVFTSSALGNKSLRECGRIWRRNLPYGIWSALIIIVICWPAETWFLMLDQTPENADIAGEIARVLLIGMPGHIFFFISTMFLEGLGRPKVGFAVMVVANLVNAFLNWLLIYGNLGFPEMGALGSAWTSTVVRWVMGIGTCAYVWFAPSMQQYGVREPHGQRWRDWKDQRRLGNATAVALTAEVAAFGALAIYAGWIGNVQIAAYNIISQVGGIPLMTAIGIGAATTVRVGIAAGRGDRADTILAGWTGLILTVILMALFGLVIIAIVEPVLDLFTEDVAVMALIIPIAVLMVVSMTTDAGQMVMSSALRGLKDDWWPTMIQSAVWAICMIPLSYYLAIKLEWGLAGLIAGTLASCSLSILLQAARFVWLTRLRQADH